MSENVRTETTDTAGVDFASQVANTAACRISWGETSAAIVELQESCDDAYLLDLASRVTKFGIDVPLGWPTPFVDAVSMHARTGGWPEHYEHESNAKDYRLRKTDIWVSEDKALPQPLSVATDRIAIPTMRAAALFAKFTPKISLDGSGLVCEVYPAAALVRWSLTSRGYKGAGATKRATRVALVSEFAERTSQWLSFEKSHQDRCVENDNAFDAIIAALVGRAAQLNLTEPVPDKLRDAARREGWIAIPQAGTLSHLVGGVTTSPTRSESEIEGRGELK